ncbi:MAG: Gfo/Idh/MocA family oxidoreductase [Thermoguttaceae bacterium]
MNRFTRHFSRRAFLQSSAAGAWALAVVPRSVLGGPAQAPPSESFGGALIGCGGRGRGTFQGLGPNVRLLAQCDVRFKDRADNKTIYTDYRRVLERTDIDVVAIATHPGWHALISIAAMEAGKDVLCEKPMTRFIAEGRAVVEAERRFGRIFQIGTYGRFGANRQTHKLMASGLLKQCKAVVFRRGGFKIREWSGLVNPKPQPVPMWLDWDMYCGPAPLRPYHPHRFGGTHRGYWDYEGGGLADMAQHHLDGFNYEYAKDFTSPVQIEAFAPPAHPEACGLWGWVELTYADGLTLVLDGGEWGPRYDRKQPRGVSPSDLSPEDQQKLKAMPDPEPLVSFPEAIRTRKRPGGHAEAAHRTATLFHLANIAIRCGRPLRYDPVKEEIVGDEEANRLVYQPMRAPWRL